MQTASSDNYAIAERMGTRKMRDTMTALFNEHYIGLSVWSSLFSFKTELNA